MRIAEGVAYLTKDPRITLRNWSKSPALGIRSSALANSQTSSNSAMQVDAQITRLVGALKSLLAPLIAKPLDVFSDLRKEVEILSS